jgi:hypothetical protein
MRKLIALCAASLFFKAEAVIILVHGTFATDSLWCCPTGDFYTKLEEEARTLGEKVIPFTWSGKLSHKARLRAAESLARVIVSYATEKITLIGHSHGGNVITLASQLLHEELVSPVAGQEKQNLFLKAHKNLSSYKGSLMQRNPSKEYLIDHAYLLATPIDMKLYAPNMKVIKYVCNLYSKKDHIQTVLGWYTRCIATRERVVNLQVIIEHTEIQKHPSHFQMRHPIIAQWILSIPFKCIEDKTISFEHFSWGHDGIIYLDKYNKPYYQVVKKMPPAILTPLPSTLSAA